MKYNATLVIVLMMWIVRLLVTGQVYDHWCDKMTRQLSVFLTTCDPPLLFFSLLIAESIETVSV